MLARARGPRSHRHTQRLSNAGWQETGAAGAIGVWSVWSLAQDLANFTT